MKKEEKKCIYTVGQRKRSVARIRLFEGKGQILVNGKPVNEYFKDIPEILFLKPFNLAKVEGKYFATARISGGGVKGQMDAFIHGVAKALALVEELKHRKVLKSAGLLTRDSREKERRKFGNAQKARAKKQSPKR